MNECSQWGTHPHELEPPHEADGWLFVSLKHQNSKDVFEPTCAACYAMQHHDKRMGAFFWRNIPNFAI